MIADKSAARSAGVDYQAALIGLFHEVNVCIEFGRQWGHAVPIGHEFKSEKQALAAQLEELIVGVWMEPVEAQVIMTLFGTT